MSSHPRLASWTGHVPPSCALLLALVATGCDDQGQPLDERELAQHRGGGGGGGVPLPANPPPLSAVAVPQPGGGDIVDQAAAILLGKALFWDVQAGGDGETACASCHFTAGVDDRAVNTMNPGPDGVFDSGGVTGPGQTWDGTTVGKRTDDIIGSQGVVGTVFVSIDPNPDNAADVCVADQTAPFLAHRRVTGRNAPSAVGAVFYRQNFWDGRANDRFNGLDPFGSTGNSSGSLVGVTNASLASQAVGPPNNEVEMSCLGRGFNGPGSLGAKLLARTPLGKQLVDASDSVLGALSAAPADGLSCGGVPCTYTELIEDAFGAALAADAEAQFSRIWGQAIQAYEATLVPDDTPFDRFLAGDASAITGQQLDGWIAFKESGCFACHAGSELSDATVSFAAANGVVNSDGGDQGFHNIGVRPTEEDLGRAGSGPNGVSWSESGSMFDRGAFKTPALRNLKLTGPYMHNGGIATIDEALRFYNGSTGFFGNAEVSGLMVNLSLSGGDRTAMDDFLANALTDCRTELERAPFDHPELPLPNGGTLAAVGANGTGPCP